MRSVRELALALPVLLVGCAGAPLPGVAVEADVENPAQRSASFRDASATERRSNWWENDG